MERGWITVGVACLVVLSGCAGGIVSSGNDETTSVETTATPTETPTATPTETPTATPTETPTATPTVEPWTEPKQPNRPLENKLSEGNRIESVEVVDESGSSEAGHAESTLEITANTSMPDIDPAEYGTVKGEPFFLVYVNGSIDNSSDKVEAGGTLLKRSEILPHEESGTFTLTVREGGLEEAGVEEGEVELTVLLMDKDSDWDDIYGMSEVTVEYTPASESGSSG